MTAGRLPQFLPSEPLRDRVRLFLAANPRSPARAVAAAFRLKMTAACSVLRELGRRGDVVASRARDDGEHHHKRVYFWTLTPRAALSARILEALDAPREMWGVAKELDVPESRAEVVLVLLASEGLVRQMGGMWERVGA